MQKEPIMPKDEVIERMERIYDDFEGELCDCFALASALKALKYDDVLYHEEHGEVIVEKAVWEDAKRALEAEQAERPSAKPKSGYWRLVDGEPPKNSLSVTTVLAECSCCGEPLKQHGRELGFGYDKEGRAIVWSGFIANYQSNPSVAKAFAMDAAKSVPQELFPRYCENCGAKMESSSAVLDGLQDGSVGR